MGRVYGILPGIGSEELGRMICGGRIETAASTRGRRETARGRRVSIHHVPTEGRIGSVLQKGTLSRVRPRDGPCWVPHEGGRQRGLRRAGGRGRGVVLLGDGSWGGRWRLASVRTQSPLLPTRGVPVRPCFRRCGPRGRREPGLRHALRLCRGKRRPHHLDLRCLQQHPEAECVGHSQHWKVHQHQGGGQQLSRGHHGEVQVSRR